jgi:ankyrin repeat domain-containing protein 50
MWVMSADRPLQSTELLSAIQVELDQDTESTGKITESHLLGLCKNLLVLDSQRNLWMFSHHSVREYLQDNHWNLGQAHCYAA